MSHAHNTEWFNEAMGGALDVLGGGKSTIPRPQTDDELWHAVKKYLNIEIPRVQVCADHVAPFTAFADAFFARTPIGIWWASRGFGGKSLTLSTLSLAEAIFLGAKVNLLGGSGEQAERILAYMNGEEMTTSLWGAKNAPKHLIVGGEDKGLQKRLTRLSQGGYIKALMASQTSVRGPHPQRLRLDETDEMDIKIFDAALGQPMARDGIRANIVASSTYHNANGTMTELLKRAADKDWPVYQWCYRENLQSNGGWLDDKEVADKKATVTVVMWNTEYENQEPNPEGRAIDDKAVKKAFAIRLGRYTGALHEYLEFEEPFRGGMAETYCHRCRHPYFDASSVLSLGIKIEHLPTNRKVCANCGTIRRPARSGLYSTGTDWAKKKDFTVIITLRYDVSPVRLVAFERTGRMDWPAMVSKLEYRLKRYGGQSFHDETGIGDVLGDFVMGIPSQGVWMQGRDRATMLSNYITAIERGDVIFPRIKWMFDEHRLASVEDVYSTGKKYHLPDSIAAGSLAWLGIMSGQTGEILIPGQNVMIEDKKKRDEDDDYDRQPPMLITGRKK